MGKAIDWIQVFIDAGIPYKEDSQHTAKGEVSVCCPFCDYDDSFFLGVNLDSGAYGCWYSSSHRGFSPIRLLRALLHISQRAAVELLSEYTGSDLSQFNELSEDTFSVTFDKNVEEENECTLHESFNTLDMKSVRDRRFVQYFVNRGFKRSDLPELFALYGIRAATSGLWSDRIILPVYDEYGLATWTARAIGDSSLRYMTLSYKTEMDSSIARKSIKDIVYQQPDIVSEGGDVLVVTEGPFDSLKLDMYGRSLRVRCACLFGKTVSESQIDTLRRAAANFKKVVFVLDAGTGWADVEMSLTLQGSSREQVPFGKDDLGDLSWKEATMFSKRLRRKYSNT